MMIPKQNPVRPAPVMAPSSLAVKPNSEPQFARIPPRTPNPTPVARIATKPAHSSRAAFEVFPSRWIFMLDSVFGVVVPGVVQFRGIQTAGIDNKPVPEDLDLAFLDPAFDRVPVRSESHLRVHAPRHGKAIVLRVIQDGDVGHIVATLHLVGQIGPLCV